MNCEDIALILDDVDIRTLEGEVHQAVEDHLAGCPVCDRVWTPLAHLAKSRTPALPQSFVDRCAALVVAESLPNGKRRAHTRLFVLGCFVVGAAAAGILTMHHSDRRPPESLPSFAVMAPAMTNESDSIPMVTHKQVPLPDADVTKSVPAVGPDQSPAVSEYSKSTADAPNGQREIVAALPGIAGFDLPEYLSGGRAATALAAESKDPSWAYNMERRINEALQKKEGLRPARVEIECRMTACGVLFVYPPEAHDGEYREQKAHMDEIKVWLKDTLGFSGSGTSTMTDQRKGTHFTVLFLQRAIGRERYLPTTSTHMISALPGTPGFEIPVAGLAVMKMPAEQLAAEPVDRSSWPLSTESALKKEALAVAGDHWTQILIECRVTYCGIVLSNPRTGGRNNGQEIAEHLASVLGLTNGGSIKQTNLPSGEFVVIYLRRVDQP